MAETKIEWTATEQPDGTRLPGYTFNHVIGCTKVAAGCRFCYAEAFSKRTGKAVWGPAGTRIKTSPSYWHQPLKWNAEARKAGARRAVFCASLADVFEDWPGNILSHERDKETGDNTVLWWRDDIGTCRAGQTTLGKLRGERLAKMSDLRAELFELIDQTPWLLWLVLTKRPENILSMLPDLNYYRVNLMFGTSIAEQKDADRNIEPLLEAKKYAAGVFLSCEPLVESVKLPSSCLPIIDWVIVGGESGHGARPMHPAWAQSLMRQCEGGIPFFFKQNGEYTSVKPGSEFWAKKSNALKWGTLDRSGKWFPATTPWNGVTGDESETGEVVLYQVGKKAAGNELFGKAYQELPRQMPV